MAARILPLGHKSGAEREDSRVRAVTASAVAEGEKRGGVGAPPGNPSLRIRNARNAQQRQLHNRIKNARANSTHLRPAQTNRAIRGGYSAEPTSFGSRG